MSSILLTLWLKVWKVEWSKNKIRFWIPLSEIFHRIFTNNNKMGLSRCIIQIMKWLEPQILTSNYFSNNHIWATFPPKIIKIYNTWITNGKLLLQWDLRELLAFPILWTSLEVWRSSLLITSLRLWFLIIFKILPQSKVIIK